MGNASGAATLEITLVGPTLRVQRECLIAVCGATFDLWVGTLPVPLWLAVYVRAGQIITFGARRGGARAYLAISGGIALPLPEWLTPISYIVPGQLFALYLSLARGHDPDQPRGLKKVTVTR